MPLADSIRRLSKESRGDAVRSWARRHAYSFFSSIGALIRRPLSSALTISVLALTLTLPIGLYLTVDHLRLVVGSVERQQSLSVFLRTDASETDALGLASVLGGDEAVLAVDPISPDDGLRQVLGYLGVTNQPSENVANPLPWVLEVTPRADADLDKLARRLSEADMVSQVLVDLAWLERLDQLIELGLRLASVIGVLMLCAVLAVVANATRVEVERRRHQIDVMALVGATPGFIRRPFLYSGFWVGAIAAMVALLLTQVAYWLLEGPLSTLAQSYQIPVVPTLPSPLMSLFLICAMGGMGVLGSAVAVRQQLRGIWPTH